MKTFTSAVILGTMLVSGCGGAPVEKPAGPPVEVTAADVSKAYQENEAKAQIAYEGKVLKITGVVKDIDLSIGDAPVIRLKGSGDQLGMGVTQDGKMTDVSLSGMTKEVAAGIDKGKKMTFTCQSIQEIMGGAHLGECQIAT